MEEIVSSVHIVPKPGTEAAEIEGVFAELVAAADAEDGVLGYAYYRGEDGSYRVIERYASSETFLEHMGKMDEAVLGRLVELADFPSVEVLGDPSPEARASFDTFGALYRSSVVAIGTPPS